MSARFDVAEPDTGIGRGTASVASLRPERGRGAGSASGGGRLTAALYLAPGILGLVVFIVGPLIASLGMSLFDWSLLGTPEFIGLDNYRRLLFDDPSFWTIVGNTLVIVFVYVPLNILLATVTATWLTTRMKGRSLFRVLFLLPALTPMVANALIWRFILSDDGLVNTLLAAVGIQGPSWLGTGGWALTSIIIVSVWQSFGYNMVIIGAGLDAVDRSVLEAARIDGAGAFTRFRTVTLPLISPSLFFTTVMTVIGAFQIFVQPYMMTRGGPGQSTNTLVLYLYQSGFTFDRLGYASAIGWVLFAFVMVVTALQFIAQRKLVHYA